MNCLKQKKGCQGQIGTTKIYPELLIANQRRQELPGDSKSLQVLPEAQDVPIATQEQPRTTKTCEVMTRAVDNAKNCQELAVANQIYQWC